MPQTILKDKDTIKITQVDIKTTTTTITTNLITPCIPLELDLACAFIARHKSANNRMRQWALVFSLYIYKHKDARFQFSKTGIDGG